MADGAVVRTLVSRVRERTPLAALLVCAFLLVGGCVTRVTPPVNPADPITVYLTDRGYHSSLLLPIGDGRLVEYSYGDYKYLALRVEDEHWYHGPEALLFSQQAGLGRRFVVLPRDEGQIAATVHTERVAAIEVEHSRLRAWVETMDQRYRRHIDTEKYCQPIEMYFVIDDEHYGVFNNCNQLTARALRALGCQVNGAAIGAHFVLEGGREVKATPATTSTSGPSASTRPAATGQVNRDRD